MALSESIKSTLRTKYNLDEVSFNVISKIIEKNNITIIEADGDLYVKTDGQNILQKIDIKSDGGPNLTYWINILKNIQADKLNKSCSHVIGGSTSCSNCKDDGVMVSATVNNGLLLHYLYEKINILENAIKCLKSTISTTGRLESNSSDNLTSKEYDKNIKHNSDEYKRIIDINALYNLCKELTVKYTTPIWILDVAHETTYYVHQYQHITEKFLVPLERLKIELSTRKQAHLVFEQDDILIFSKLTCPHNKELMEKITEAFVPKKALTNYGQVDKSISRTSFSTTKTVHDICVELSKQYLCELYLYEDSKSYNINANESRILTGDTSNKAYIGRSGMLLMFEHNNTSIYYVSSSITITYNDLQNMRNELTKLFS